MNDNNIPKELQELKQWVCWKFELRDSKQTKIPINPITGGRAMSNNSKTWGTIVQAKQHMQKCNLPGIGFMFSGDGIVGVDIDNCKDVESGALSPEAADIISTLDSYTEISQSGKGVHILCRGVLPDGARRKGSVEMYEKERYFIMTGNVLDDAHASLEDRTAELAIVHERYLQKQTKKQQKQTQTMHSNIDLSDQEIINKAGKSKNNGLFNDLWAGNWQHRYKSHSDADLAFCNLLAFWTRRDPNTIDRIFRQSGMFRDKWIESRPEGTYGDITIRKAISDCMNVYDPKNNTQYVPQKNVKGIDSQEETDNIPDGTIDTNDNNEIVWDGRYCSYDKKNDRYKPKNLKENIITLLNFYQIIVRYNEIIKDLEITIPGKSFSQDNNDEVVLEFLFNKCIYHGFSGISKDRLNAILLEIGDENRYNPISEYLDRVFHENKLHLNDSELNKLIDTIQAPTIPNEMKTTLIKKWMISCAAAAYRPDGVISHGVLILKGAQGIGKTSWFRRLVPNPAWFKDGLTIDPSSKDRILTAIQYWIVEMGEIESTFKKDLPALKAFITNQKDVIRRPYARKESKYPRKTIFCGSVNSEEFLKDDTGNRRFWVIPAEEINYQHDVNIDLLWAEVVKLYKDKFPYWLSSEETDALAAINKESEERDSIDALIEINFRWETKERFWLKATDVFKIIGSPQNISLRRIVAALRRRCPEWKMGFHWRQIDGYKYYAVPKEINANLYNTWDFKEISSTNKLPWEI